ncbi:MAG: putative bifunctional diguanylate cyclase/phosphodiesterase [Nitratireductor sp.]
MKNKDLPLEVFKSVLHSLHGDTRALFVGKVAAWIAFSIAAYISQSNAIWVATGLTVAVGIVRVLSIKSFNKISDEDLDHAILDYRQKVYTFWAGLYVSLLGAVCFLGLANSTDGVVHLIIISATLASIARISGRNFASSKVVDIQIALASVPLIGGLIMYGGFYHMLLGLLLLPFMFGMRSLSTRLRQMLFDAVFTAMDNKLIADRFETTLKNLTHGIAMVDQSGRIVVVNQRFNETFGLPESFNAKGVTMSALLEQEFLTRNTMTARSSLAKRLEQCLKAAKKTKFQFRKSDDTVLEVSFTPMSSYAGVIVLEDISERLKTDAEIKQLANYDSLTHLPNRRYFIVKAEEANNALGPDVGYSLFFIDVDKFKDINDMLGHDVGDKLLCVISLRLKAVLPKGAFVGRFGGDEFIVMFPGLSERAFCEKYAEDILEQMKRPILIDGHTINVGGSIGIAMNKGKEVEFEQLLKMADVSLYEAKTSGRGKYFFYNEDLAEKLEQRTEMEMDLRKSIDAGELTVFYQPLVDIKRNEVACCEALLRWSHPVKGNIPPSIFIPIAEEIGLISRIGKFVLDEATKECTRWPENVRVAVNVSSIQFKQTDVCAIVNSALKESGLEPSRLEVEVTETAMIDNMAETSRVLRTLAQSGVRVSLDDFGTGFSSLSYLHQLPLDKVKIDKSFVDTIQDNERSLTLLSGVANLANDLGLEVIVEGVERVEQLDILKANVNVDIVQGYLFSKPIPAFEVRQYIGKNVGDGSEIQNLLISA